MLLVRSSEYEYQSFGLGGLSNLIGGKKWINKLEIYVFLDQIPEILYNEDNLRSIIDRMLLIRVEFNMTNLFNGIAKDGNYYLFFFTQTSQTTIFYFTYDRKPHWCNFIF